MEYLKTQLSHLHLGKPEHGALRVGIRHNEHYKRSGTASYLHALRKFLIDPPPEGSVFVNKQSRLAVRDDDQNEIGEVPTENFQNDAFYLCPVTIGEGDHTITVNLDFDTGSTDLWVWASELDSSVQRGSHHVYDPSKSPTAKKMEGSTWNITYGDGSFASGDVYTDTVTIGGIKIVQQAIECANAISPAFITGQDDGLLGLAFSTNTVKPNPVNTPVANMDAQDAIPPENEVFTCKLSRHDEEPGFYTFGFIDEAHVQLRTPHYAPVIDTSGFWKVVSSSATIGDTVFPRPNNTAIADTGTSLCLVESSFCKAIYAQIPGAKFDSHANGWVFPVTVTEDKLPTISLGIGDPNTTDGEQRFKILPRDSSYSTAYPGWIYGGFQDRGGNPFDILGDVFLKNVYAIWDVKSKRFGCCPREAGPFIVKKDTFLNKGVVLQATK